MKQPRFVIIALLSLALLAQELIWTRIFSAEFFYTYAFLVLSLAMMGLGLGALSVRLFPSLGRPCHLGLMLSLTAGATLAGPPLVFSIGLDFAKLLDSWSMIARLVLAVILLSSAYFFGGVAFAGLFRNNHRDMPKLYMADLLGAGIGVLLAIVMMNRLGTPGAAFLVALPILVAAILAARGWGKLVPLPLLIAALVLFGDAGELLKAERKERAKVIDTHWDAMAKVKIFGFTEYYRGLEIDNAANSPVLGFDGDWDRPDREEVPFDIDVSYLIDRFESCRFLSLGAGGGSDVFQALQAGASEIHAVEVVPYVNELMTTGALADFTGRIYLDDRVRVVTEDARAYVRRHKNQFDVIYSLSSNSWAALASGSFALAENYLFTTEAFIDYWEALTDDGFLSMEHQFYMPRLVGALIDALEELGVPDPQTHFAVYDLPMLRRKLLLLSKRPLTDEIRNNAYGKLTPYNSDKIHLEYPTPKNPRDNVFKQIVARGWEEVADSVPVNISPATDDRPFVGQMGLWRNFKWEKPRMLLGLEVFGFPLSKVIVVIILGVVVVLVLPLTLLPCLTHGPRLPATAWGYFFTIGAAFMAVEVVLIQKYTLLVGPSAYSIAAILLALLISCAVGSRFSRVVSDGAAFIGIIAWLLLEAFALSHVTEALASLTMLPRIAAAAALVAPLGFFMGMPFPKGACYVGDLIDWGFAVNGAASVLGGTGVVLLAMEYGFQMALAWGAGAYLVAYLLLRIVGRWRPTEPVPTSFAETGGDACSRLSERVLSDPDREAVLPTSGLVR